MVAGPPCLRPAHYQTKNVVLPCVTRGVVQDGDDVLYYLYCHVLPCTCFCSSDFSLARLIFSVRVLSTWWHRQQNV